MYGLFLDKSARDSKALLDYVSKWKQEHRLKTEDYFIDSVDEITTICQKNGKKFSTIVAVGSQNLFSAVVSEARFFEPQSVLAYIPTSNDLLAKRLGLRDYKDACQTVTQRKIIELTALSVNQRYFLFDYQLKVTKNHQGEVAKTTIILDKTMKIQMPANLVVVHNRNQELLPHNSAILLEAFKQATSSASNTNLLKLQVAKLTADTDQQGLQLRLPAQHVEIESSISLADIHDRALKAPIKIGFHKRVIRLIVKRGQAPQAIMSPGLIS